MVQIKRAYEPAAKADGERFLVERLWPRGVTKKQASLTAWLKELAPSTGLRQWFHEDPETRWPEFQKRYQAELKAPEKQQMLRELAAKAKKGTITLVFGAKDAEHNSAVVLKQLLEGRKK